MAYNAKINWKHNDPVTEGDFNRIEQGIKDAHELVGENASNIIEHEQKTNNPHKTNKAQVGLSDVENYGIATKAEAEAGTSNNKYMTPLRTKEAVQKLAPTPTKEMMGLGNVDNIKQASKTEFDNHKSDTEVHFKQGEKQDIHDGIILIASQAGNNAANILDLQNKLASINFNMQSQEPIFGVVWDKQAGPELERTDVAKNMDIHGFRDESFTLRVLNSDFDSAPIFGEIKKTIVGANVFQRIPKFYIRKQDGPRFKSWQISKNQYPGFYLPACFWDFNNNKELPYLDYGRFKGWIDDTGKLRSKEGEFPTINQTIVEFRQAARLNGKGYQITDIHAIDALRTLVFIELGTLDVQSVMNGFVNGRYHDADTVKESANANHVVVDRVVADRFREGQSISVGSSRGGNQRFYGRKITGFQHMGSETTLIKFDGDPAQTYAGDFVYNTAYRTGGGFGSFNDNETASDFDTDSGLYPITYRGIENPWGDLYEWIDGINVNNHQAWVADNADDYTSNLFANPYKKLGYANANVNGYAKGMGFDTGIPYAEFPVETGGSASTYYTDNYYQDVGQRVARFGGYWFSGSNAGLSTWYLAFSSSNRYVYTGSRLLRKPL